MRKFYVCPAAHSLEGHQNIYKEVYSALCRVADPYDIKGSGPAVVNDISGKIINEYDADFLKEHDYEVWICTGTSLGKAYARITTTKDFVTYKSYMNSERQPNLALDLLVAEAYYPEKNGIGDLSHRFYELWRELNSFDQHQTKSKEQEIFLHMKKAALELMNLNPLAEKYLESIKETRLPTYS